MAINLATEYSERLDERFKKKSLTDQWCGHNYDWTGSNAISVWTLEDPEINDYSATGTNRYGTPTEVEDELNTYALTRKRSISKTMDITNIQDTKNVRKVNAYLKSAWDNKYVPEIDKYRLTRWANGAGLGKVNSTALTKTTVIQAMLEANAALNNELVPNDNRVCFVTETLAVQTRLADELKNNESFTTKAIINGQIARLVGMPIVATPDSYMPAGVEFMIKWKNASADPMKLKQLLAHHNPPGVAGYLIEGLVRYDSFVLAQKVNGIYVYAKSGVCAAPTATLASNELTLASSDSGTIKYTTDGSNPKTSKTAVTYTAKFSVTSGDRIRMYASKSGMIDSAIAEYTVA